MFKRKIYCMIRICSTERCKNRPFLVFLFILLFPGITSLKANSAAIKENKEETMSIGNPRLVLDTIIYDLKY